MIAIIDYGIGNLRSIQNALEKVSLDSVITDDPNYINKSKGIILPGVGAFKDAIENLEKKNLVPTIYKNVYSNKPILGICLGMQLLYEKSYENGVWKGLGLLEGDIVKLSGGVKIPHMGWNNLKLVQDNNICKYIKDEDYVYFVHSYYARSHEKNVVGNSDYGIKIPAIVAKDNIYGMQFHPEKSGKTGLKLLKAFGELIR